MSLSNRLYPLLSTGSSQEDILLGVPRVQIVCKCHQQMNMSPLTGKSKHKYFLLKWNILSSLKITSMGVARNT